MKKKYSIIFGAVVAVIILFGFKVPAQASTYMAQLVLDSYELSDDYKMGEDTSIKVVFRNTDASYYIRNVLINCSSNGNTVIPVEGKSNQFFVESIRPNETYEVEIPIIITHSESGYASMNFSVEYMSDDTRWSASSYIVFPVKEDGSAIVLKSVNVPGDVLENNSVLISAYFLNSSDEDMFNTEFIVNGEIGGGEKTTSLGTVTAKRNAYGESYVSFANAGKKIITLSIRYEDASGESHEDVIGQYSVEVSENTVDTGKTGISDYTGDTDTEVVKEPISVATLLLMASGVIVLVIIVVVIVNVTRRRK